MLLLTASVAGLLLFTSPQARPKYKPYTMIIKESRIDHDGRVVSVSKRVFAQRSDGTLSKTSFQRIDDAKPWFTTISSFSAKSALVPQPGFQPANLIQIQHQGRTWARYPTYLRLDAAVRDPANVTRSDFFGGGCLPRKLVEANSQKVLEQYRQQGIIGAYGICDPVQVELSEPLASWFEIPAGYTEFPKRDELDVKYEELKKVADKSQLPLTKPYTVTLRRLAADRDRRTIGYGEVVIAVRADGGFSVNWSREQRDPIGGRTMIRKTAEHIAVNIDHLSRSWTRSVTLDDGMSKALSDPTKPYYLRPIYTTAMCAPPGRARDEFACVPIRIERGEPAASWFEIPKGYRELSYYDSRIVSMQARGEKIAPETDAAIRRFDAQQRQRAAELGLKPSR
jgi:hypothetical protein